jgi:hypothetical protein
MVPLGGDCAQVEFKYSQCCGEMIEISLRERTETTQFKDETVEASLFRK